MTYDFDELPCPNCGEKGTLSLVEDVAFSKCHPSTYITSDMDLIEDVNKNDDNENEYEYYFCSNCMKFIKGSTI